MLWTRPISLVNARVLAEGGLYRSIRFSSHVLSIGRAASRHDVIIDAGSAFVLPGLINAHDHLELNHYGLLKFRSVHANASEWIDDVHPRLKSDGELLDAQRKPLADRLLVGGIKNLLSGVTTVAHHNPLYAELRRGFPVRLVRRFGWAHSFYLSGRNGNGQATRDGAALEIAGRYAATKGRRPFIMHVAEGSDAAASTEASRLDALGCLHANTVLVHGTGIEADQWKLICARRAGLVWCPASNVFLLGRTLDPHHLEQLVPRSLDRIALGTDSRLTGSRDLLDELRVADSLTSAGRDVLVEMVTRTPARLMQLGYAGRLQAGWPADLIVVPAAPGRPADALLACRRADLQLVVVGGRPMVASPGFADAFSERPSTPVIIDGRPMVLDKAVAGRLARSSIQEPGVEIATS